MTNTTTKKGAVKGTVAAAAGIAVLLGGAGTFALWNQSGNVGSVDNAIGSLTADFGDSLTWTDQTAGDGQGHTITDINAFRMVPGDVVVGEVGITGDAVGQNLKAIAELDYTADNLPSTVDATVSLINTSTKAPVDAIVGTDEGTDFAVTARVTLKFDEEAQGEGGAIGSMGQTINLSDINVKLQQVADSNVAP